MSGSAFDLRFKLSSQKAIALLTHPLALVGFNSVTSKEESSAQSEFSDRNTCRTKWNERLIVMIFSDLKSRLVSENFAFSVHA